jgi:hypothetical protein
LNYTQQELEMLRDTENAAVLRDLCHSDGWKVYLEFAHRKIETLMKDYLRHDLTNEQIIEAHLRLQAISQYQSSLEDLVRGAVDFIDPANLQQMILSWRIPPDV